VFEFTSKTMRIGAISASLTTLLWSGAPAAYSDEVAGQVTASIDSDLGGSIADGEHLRVGEDAGCSVLLDDNAVVELCGQTSVVFERDRDSNRRIVSRDSGEIRIVVEPRDFEERIEIHTPAAIATLLGTIVHVSVDPETGATTISSAQSKVSVRSDETDVRGTTVLAAGDQVTVQPGEAPSATRPNASIPRRSLNSAAASSIFTSLRRIETAEKAVSARRIGSQESTR
jgi:hypothetical protein